MSLDVLKQEYVNIVPVFFDLYDQHLAAHEEVRGLLARTHDNRVARENPVNLNYLMSFPTATSWLDDIVFEHSLDDLKWTVPLEGHHVAVPFNALDVGRPNTLAKLQAIVPTLPQALNLREIEMISEVFHQNPKSVTGKAFFAVDHPRSKNLVGLGEFSNILAPEFDSLTAPALQVLAELINEVLTHFSTIGTARGTYTDDDKVRGNLLVIVHNDKYQTLFRELKASTVLPGFNLPDGTVVGERQSTVKDSFRLWRDHKAPAGQEDYIEFVMLTDSMAPKCAIYVVDTDPEPILLEENKMKSGYYGIGVKQIFAVKPFIPNVAIQARPVLAPPALAGGIPGSGSRATPGAPRLELLDNVRRNRRNQGGGMGRIFDLLLASDPRLQELFRTLKEGKGGFAPKESDEAEREAETAFDLSDVPGLLERLPNLDRSDLDVLHELVLERKPHGNARDDSVRDTLRAALEARLGSEE